MVTDSELISVTLHDTEDVAPIELQEQATSTGELPARDLIDELLREAYDRYRDDDSGVVANYIPALASADPAHFGICLASIHGRRHSVGDTGVTFSLQSLSKAFVFALMNQHLGHDVVHEAVGVNNTGLPFSSVMAIELNDGKPMNPFVNAGAMATTALVAGKDLEARWAWLLAGLSRFAGRELSIDHEVYASESSTNHRNRAIARLLYSYGVLATDPEECVELYTRQCSLSVSVEDLAVMGATLAGGGVNPLTGDQVVEGPTCSDTLAALATAGMYERSGDWLYEIGVPGKSGVSGGIITIAPGKGALGTYSAPLDAASISVRGQRTAHFLSGALGLNVFASRPSDSRDWH